MAAIKTELKKMIDEQNDVSVLKAIRTLLQKAGLDSTLKEKLTIRALKSEQDIKAGRLFSRKDVVKRTNHFLSK
ncbi:MAG: hypothetical protein SH857_09470 [Chitinophagales bacterium]|nr:hypothetical protein [Chitinophagales bacterium]